MITELKKLYRAGLISYKPIYYIEISGKVKELKASGMNHTPAINKVAEDSGVSIQTVYRAVKLIGELQF